MKHYLKYSNKDDFNFDVIKKKSEEINKLGFVRQIKDPEILFKKDSTIIYLYLEKVKNNSFDGFIGFATTSATSDDTAGSAWTPAIGDLLTVAAAVGSSGKVTKIGMTGLLSGTGSSHGFVVGRVDSYDSASGLLYFTQLSAL